MLGKRHSPLHHSGLLLLGHLLAAISLVTDGLLTFGIDHKIHMFWRNLPNQIGAGRGMETCPNLARPKSQRRLCPPIVPFVLAATSAAILLVEPTNAQWDQRFFLPGVRGKIRAIAMSGADVYVGHSGRSESPVFYVYFLRRWLRGVPIADAVAASNENTRTVLATTGGLMYRGRPFDDPAIAIEWPIPVIVASEQDRNWPLIEQVAP